MENLVRLVEQWHVDRNLIDGATDKDQVLKLIQEMGELSDNVCKGRDIRDDLGDMLVVMINIMKRNNILMEECLQVAYNDIKDRKGKMIDGIFVKQDDIIEQGLQVNKDGHPAYTRYPHLNDPTKPEFTKWQKTFVLLPVKTIGGKRVWLSTLWKRTIKIAWTPPRYPAGAYSRIQYATLDEMLNIKMR